jgi:hypothetical protein
VRCLVVLCAALPRLITPTDPPSAPATEPEEGTLFAGEEPAAVKLSCTDRAALAVNDPNSCRDADVDDASCDCVMCQYRRDLESVSPTPPADEAEATPTVSPETAGGAEGTPEETGTQVEPTPAEPKPKRVRTRPPTPMLPRRVRRLVRFAQSLPPLTRMQRLRLAVYEPLVRIVMRHELAVCNLTVWSLVAYIFVTIARFRGAVVPASLLLPLWCCTFVAFISFHTLCSELSRPRLCLPIGKSADLANSFPAIKNVTGMALKMQLDAFIEHALAHHLGHGGLEEEFYVSTLLQKAGLQSAIGLTLTQISYNTLINGVTPMAYFLNRARAERVRWKKLYGAQPENVHQANLRRKIEELDVRFTGTPEQRAGLNYWMQVIENPRAYYFETVNHAREAVAAIQRLINEPAQRWEQMTPSQKMFYLLTVPEYKEQAEIIKAQFEFDSRHYPEDKSKYQPFAEHQFQSVNEFTVLQEMKEYIVAQVGSITEHHVNFWRKRRMGKGETPLAAYAKLKGDAATLAQTNPTFRADVEVYNIVTRADLVGGTFFPEPLFDVVESIMQQKKQDYDERDLDYYSQIADLWAVHAQKESTDAPGRKPKLYARNEAELNRRGPPLNWNDADRIILKDLKDRETDAAPKGEGGKGKGAAKFHCTYCQKTGTPLTGADLRNGMSPPRPAPKGRLRLR